MKIFTLRTYNFFASPMVFFIASTVWFLILAQTISFFYGLFIFTLLVFLIFRAGFTINRRAGMLFGIKTKKQVLAISLVVAAGFAEIFWAVSFMPFSFYTLGGIMAVVFTVSFIVLKSYYERLDIKSLMIKNILFGIILIAIFIGISSWLPKNRF